MKNKVFLALSGLAVTLSSLSGCSSSDKVHLNACQDITRNLLGVDAITWRKHSQSQDDQTLQVELAYATTRGEGRAICRFGPEPDDDDAGITPRGFVHVPEEVVINGEPVSQQRLVRATLEVTGQSIVKNASAAMEKSKEVAGHTAVQAREVSQAASRKLAETGEVVKEKARHAAEKLQDALKKSE